MVIKFYYWYYTYYICMMYFNIGNSKLKHQLRPFTENRI